jgi:hypothetical protein
VFDGKRASEAISPHYGILLNHAIESIVDLCTCSFLSCVIPLSLHLSQFPLLASSSAVMSCLPNYERRLVDSVVTDLRVRVARALDRALTDCTSEQREIAKREVLAEFDNVGLRTGGESSDRPVFSLPESDSGTAGIRRGIVRSCLFSLKSQHSLFPVSVNNATQPDLPSPASSVSDLVPSLATEDPPTSLASHSDSHILSLLTRGRLKHRVLETHLAPDFTRAVLLRYRALHAISTSPFVPCRRQFLASRLAHSPTSIERIPTRDLDYSQVPPLHVLTSPAGGGCMLRERDRVHADPTGHRRPTPRERSPVFRPARDHRRRTGREHESRMSSNHGLSHSSYCILARNV